MTGRNGGRRGAQAAVGVRSSAKYGRYLVDGEGRALYLFIADTRGTASTGINCRGFFSK